MVTDSTAYTNETTLDALVKEYAEVTATIENQQRVLDEIKAELLLKMEEEQIKTHEVQDGGKVYRATYVQATRTEIDEQGLSQVIDLMPYSKVVLDKKALESAMETGDADPFVVGQYVTERKVKPSVRFSIRAAEDS